MAKRNALGRGLGAILSDVNKEKEYITETSDKKEIPVKYELIGEIDIDKIEANPFQPRNHFDKIALQELADSIAEQGIIQPITVRRIGEDKFQLISGERRLQASKIAGLTKIPAYIRTANDEQMLELALIENIQRQDLNPIEIALAYQRLIEECGLSLENLGIKVGKDRSTVNNYLRLLKLPYDIQVGLRDNLLSMGHARAIINVENIDLQLKIYKQIIDEGLSVRAVEKIVRDLSYANEEKQKRKQSKKEEEKLPSSLEIHIRKVQEGLSSLLGTKVTLNHTLTGRGEIKINYETEEELNRILEQFAHIGNKNDIPR
ncbi:MAG: ParB/RepB/Spo0J family partition protein [Bacteroidia bacterium]|nr:ParB/RepB/Spo0J family partition protein [Bacteroidia bacterium]MDW8346261.1 ParB/RepB/Spo0J family partition protein [Bacteroidia bacterium]